MVTKNTSIRFDEQLHEQLVGYSKITGQSVSAVVEEAVAAYLVKQELVTDHKQTIDEFVLQFKPLMEKLKDM